MDRSDAARGGSMLLVATAIAGGLGYAMQVLAGRQLTAAEYGSFAVAWGAVFGIAGALAGVQQEIATRATPGLAATPRPSRVVVGVAAVPAVIAVVAALVVPGMRWELLAVALGVVGSVALLVTTGFGYASRAWRLVATAMVLEAVVRLVLLEAALLLAAPIPVVLLALVAPFAITAGVMAGPVARAARAQSVGLGTSGRRLAADMGRTLVATAATAVLVSALPLFLDAAATGTSASAFGAFVFAFTLTRAPFVIVLLAVQSFLVTLFRAHLDRVVPRLLAILGAILVLVALAAAVVGLVGPSLLVLVGSDYRLDGWTLAWIVLSAAPMAVLAVTGPLVLAAGLRSAYAAGWVVAAAVAVLGVLVLPGPLDVVALVAVSVGPILGAAVHVAAIARSRRA